MTWTSPTEGLEEGPHGFGHDARWCRNCQEGCGEEYGGPCHCCTAWSREDDALIPDVPAPTSPEGGTT